MAYSAMAVANAFVKRAKENNLPDLSPMKLQKILFFAQSWHLARHNRPLIDDFFCRWQYGPVIPSLYHEFKEYGSGNISTYGGHIVEEDGLIVKKRPIISDKDSEVWKLVDDIISVYGKYTGSELSTMTHQREAAWKISGAIDGGPISNDCLKEAIKKDIGYIGQFK